MEQTVTAIVYNNSDKVVKRKLLVVNILGNLFYHKYNEEEYIFVYLYKGIYVEVPTHFNKFYIAGDYVEKYKEDFTNISQKIIDYFEGKQWLKDDYPKKIIIELLQLVGEAGVADSLIEKRAKYIELLDTQAKEAKEAKERNLIQQQSNNAIKNIEILKNGGNISFSELYNIVKYLGIKIHIRTIGTINSMSSGHWISKTEVYAPKKMSQSTVNSLVSVVSTILTHQ